MKGPLAASLASASLLTGCASLAGPQLSPVEIGPQLEHVEPLHKATIRELNGTFEMFKRFWSSESIDTPMVHLKLISNGSK
jgi:hypothetical protein